MHHRILGLTIGVLVAALFFVAPASAASLAKGTARAAAQQKAAKFTAQKDWAKATRLGECQRTGRARVVCLGRVIGPQRNCRIRVVVWKAKHTNARLRTLHCGKTTPKLLATIRLTARLSSAPKRNLADPFEATYDYSAGATQQSAASEEETEPPAGVLQLFVNGILQCAENVTASNRSAECLVQHDQIGEYKVTTIYTSGNESAADAMSYALEPLATRLTLEVSYVPQPIGAGPEPRIGTLMFSGVSEPAGAGEVVLRCARVPGGEDTVVEPGCLDLSNPLNGPLVVSPLFEMAVFGRTCESGVCEEVAFDGWRFSGGGLKWLSGSSVEDGSMFVRAGHFHAPNVEDPIYRERPGYMPADTTAPLQFVPSPLD